MKKPALALLLLVLLLATCGPAGQAETPPSPAVSLSAPSTPTARLPVIADDDGSPDGTTAFFYLLGHPGVDLRAISISYGEANPAVYIQHIGRTLDELGIRGIPLGFGQSAPLAGNNEFPEGLRQSSDNFWGLPIANKDKTYPVQDAAALMVATVNQAPAPVTILVTGPCTNLAQALRLDPGIRDKIAAVYIMGGAVYVPGNLADLLSGTGNSVAEWNIYADPQAAGEVFESGLDIYLVPLDATNKVRIDKEDTRRWHAGGPAADWAANIYEMLMDSWGARNVAIWDLMTAAIMVRPELCAFQPLHLQVVTEEGSTSGQTALVPGGQPNVQVCLKPDVDGIKEALSEDFSNSR